jgi:hypothetical protein
MKKLTNLAISSISIFTGRPNVKRTMTSYHTTYKQFKRGRHVVNANIKSESQRRTLENHYGYLPGSNDNCMDT